MFRSYAHDHSPPAGARDSPGHPPATGERPHLVWPRWSNPRGLGGTGPVSLAECPCTLTLIGPGTGPPISAGNPTTTQLLTSRNARPSREAKP